MESLTILMIIFLPMFFSFRCKGPCECNTASNRSITSRIVNQQGQDLVFGPQRVFHFDSIYFLKSPNNFSVHTASLTRNFRDSASVVANFYEPGSKTYIYYNRQTPIDSIEIEWEQKSGTCCDNVEMFYDLKSFKVNNSFPQIENGILIIKK